MLLRSADKDAGRKTMPSALMQHDVRVSQELEDLINDNDEAANIIDVSDESQLIGGSSFGLSNEEQQLAADIMGNSAKSVDFFERFWLLTQQYTTD